MNTEDFMSAIKATVISARVDPDTGILIVEGHMTTDIKLAVMALKDKLLEFACGDCGILDPELAYDEHMIPYCTDHHFRVGLLECNNCGERTKLTSMSDCPVCVAVTVASESMAS